MSFAHAESKNIINSLSTTPNIQNSETVQATSVKIIEPAPSVSHEDKNHDWQPPHLPILKMLESKDNLPDFSEYLFMLGQHCLNTTASLVQSLLNCNAKRNHIFIIGKIYSNNAETIEWLSKNTNYQSHDQMEYGLGEFRMAYDLNCGFLWNAALEFIETSKVLFKGVIVLDDGGSVLGSAPSKIHRKLFNHKIIGIEQTSSGLEAVARLRYPTIMLASSTIKNEIEPPMIADVVSKKAVSCLQSLQKLQPPTAVSPREKDGYTKLRDIFNPPNRVVIGIIGVGHIGLAILKQLIATDQYKAFIIHDTDYKNSDKASILQTSSICIMVANKVENLLCNATIIIGCTGKDISHNMEETFSLSSTPKILISCSSKDTEFNSLLIYIRMRITFSDSYSLLDNLLYVNNLGAPILILRGGFPVNFDNSERSVLEQDIQLIRCLKFEAILQAIEILTYWEENPPADYSAESYASFKLDPNRQKNVMDLWVQNKQSSQLDFYELAYKRYCNNPNYIRENSGGVLFAPKPRKDLSNTHENSHEIRLVN